MREKDLDGVLQNGSAQSAYTVFYNEFCDVYNICFPVKIFKQGYRTWNHGYPKVWKIQ